MERFKLIKRNEIKCNLLNKKQTPQYRETTFWAAIKMKSIDSSPIKSKHIRVGVIRHFSLIFPVLKFLNTDT